MTMNVLITVKVLLFVTFINLAVAGKFENQTNVPENVNCECLGYALLAVQCSWPQQYCDQNSAAFQNYQYWCKILNDYYDRRRRGETDDTYDRYLSCQSNMTENDLTKIRNGLLMPPKIPGVVPVGGVGSSLYPFNASLPTSVNFTSQMTPIKNQGKCGACWAFNAVAICEWWYKNKSPPSVILSEQGLISCNSKGGCNGGWSQNAFSYLAANGTANSTYLYTAKNSACNISSFKTYKCPNAAYEWYIPAGNCTRLIQLLAQGPVASTIFVTAGFNQYKSGLYSDSLCPSNGTVNHGIDIVGYFKDPRTKKEAFILRNSWGTGWGMNGYMHIDASVNTCGICNFFWYYYK